MDTTIFCAAPVTPLRDAEFYAAAYRTLSPDRKARTDRLRRDADRLLSVGAELLLRLALREAGCSLLPETIRRTPDGKPFFPAGDVRFSLSHSGEYVLCAVSRDEVGCDVEQILPADPRIALRFFRREESDEILALAAGEERDELFCRYWTLKESFMKVTGLGMKLPPDAFRIRLGDHPTVEQTLNRNSYTFAESGAVPGYRCALASAGDCRDTVLRLTDLSLSVI